MPAAASVETRYQRVMDEIYRGLNYERTPDAAKSLDDFHLNKMKVILAALGDPQLAIPTVHVAGSKGKGSTSTMVARIAESAGYQVGLFTSPHVDHFEERFTINGVPPSREEVVDLYEEFQSVVEPLIQNGTITGATFFEIATVMSWMLFRRRNVQLAVMEVGLGGRLDCTNVCQPLVTIISSISRDHIRLLGNTLAAIAREKAGIIKPGVPMLIHVPEEEPATVIRQVALEQGAPLFELGLDFQRTPHVSGQGRQTIPEHYSFDFEGFGSHFENLQLGMPGEHQTGNGALATAASLLLRSRGFSISDEAIRNGLSQTTCPLRIEVIRQTPLVIVDAAHNPASISALCRTLSEVKARKRIALFASSRDKEAEVLLGILDQTMDEIWLTKFTNNPRSIDLIDLQAMAARAVTKPCRSFQTPAEAIEAAGELVTPDDLMCMTGSFFLAAECKEILRREEGKEERDKPGSLTST